MATKTAKGFHLACSECGESDVTFRLDLADLETVTCGSCDAEMTVAEARSRVAEQLRRWDALAAWIAMAGQVLAAE